MKSKTSLDQECQIFFIKARKPYNILKLKMTNKYCGLQYLGSTASFHEPILMISL